MEEIIKDKIKATENSFTKRTIGSFKELEKWALYLAVMGFIISIYHLYNSVNTLIQLSDMLEIYGEFSTRIIITTVISNIITFSMYFIPSVFLYNYSKKTKVALNSNTSSNYESAFKSLNYFYKSLGIMVIIFISMTLLGMLFFIMGDIF